MRTEYFILKDSGLHHIPDMPEKPYINFDNDFSCETAGIEYEKKKQKAIASSIPVANQEQVEKEIMFKNGWNEKHEPVIFKELVVGEIYPLECEVEIMNECDTCACHAPGCKEQKFESFVKLKEETKEEEIHIDYLEKIIFEQVKKFDINYQAFITCEIANALKSNFIITKRH